MKHFFGLTDIAKILKGKRRNVFLLPVCKVLGKQLKSLTLLHSERPKPYGDLAILSAIELSSMDLKYFSLHS